MRKTKKAFTLIELIITVTIIGILSSITVTAFFDRRRSIEYKVTLGKVQTLAAAAKNYFLSMGYYVTTTSTNNTNFVYGVNLLDGYFRNFTVTNLGGVPPTFNIKVSSQAAAAGANYTFDVNGTKTSCVGSDCVP